MSTSASCAYHWYACKACALKELFIAHPISIMSFKVRFGLVNLELRPKQIRIAQKEMLWVEVGKVLVYLFLVLNLRVVLSQMKHH